MRNALMCILSLIIAGAAAAQTAQVGASRTVRSSEKLKIEYVHYRPAEWEKEKIVEFENEIENRGGLVYVYYTNTTEKPVSLYFYRINGQDTSYWLLNHFLAWDREYHSTIAPGQTTVLELNGTTADFGPDKPFELQLVDRAEGIAAKAETTLKKDPVQVAYIRVLPDMQTLEVHVRHEGKGALSYGPITVPGAEVTGCDWVGAEQKGPGHAIARVSLAAPLAPASLLMVRVPVMEGRDERAVFAHRRAFADEFPIGTWTGRDDTLATLRRLHIDTFVNHPGGDAEKYGLRSMVHTGVPVNADTVKKFSGHPSLVCWMLQDEPDWSIAPNIMLHCDTALRQMDSTRPTFITLCRNIKFFEYAPISDIPCQDHYSVTAPSSSKWPKFYGTRLEEMAWYTRDLKTASEPKGVWVWSQGIAGWGERPKRTVPTPEELAVQLVLNLGRGAKGILWFNHDKKVAEKYPDAEEAMGRWGRVMRVLREDFLAAEKATLPVKAPDKVDVAPLVSRDKVLLCLVNTDYEIHPEAYPFQEKTNVRLTVDLPNWIQPVKAVRVTPDGVKPVEMSVAKGKANITLERLYDCDILALVNDEADVTAMEAEYQQALADEQKVY